MKTLYGWQHVAQKPVCVSALIVHTCARYSWCALMHYHNIMNACLGTLTVSELIKCCMVLAWLAILILFLFVTKN